MNYEDLTFIFIAVMPILMISLGYFGYRFYVDSNKQQLLIKVLSDSSNHIIDNDKKKIVIADQPSFLTKELGYAGFLHKSSQYVFMVISVVFGVLSGLFIFMVMKSAIALIISILVFSTFPFLVLKKIITNRQTEFNLGLKSIIDKVTSMMKSGVGFEMAFKKSILTSKSKFTRDVFGIYINEKDLIGEDKVFDRMFKLVESKELRIFYLVISIGRQSGGKFSNTLETLRKTLHDQGTIKQEITSSTKEIRVGTYMIIALTVGMYWQMNGVFEGALDEHFFGSDEGKLHMFFIVIWVAFGLFVNNMMTKIKG